MNADTLRSRLARLTGELLAEELPELLREHGRDPALITPDFAARVASFYAPQFRLADYTPEEVAAVIAATDREVKEQAKLVIMPKIRAVITALLEGK